jgi:ubiquinone/menaquinone biosynthesis C-methylase UbiE
MPATLKALERLMLMKLNLGPGPLVDILGGFSFHAVRAACELNLFETLNKKPRSIPELAAEIGCSSNGTTVLIDLLTSLGYVVRKGDRYRPSPMTEKWMLENSTADISTAFHYYGEAMTDLWPALAESVRSGKAHHNFYDWLENKPGIAGSYQRFMMALASLTAPELVKKIKIGPDPTTAIDIGGGHGLYSLALSRKNPDLSVTIFDSPYSQALAGENIKEAGMTNRVQLVEGDYLSDDLGDGYSLALLSNVLHEHTPEDNQTLLKKAAGSLAPGGRVIVLDMLRDKKPMDLQNYTTRSYALIFLHTVGGQVYSFDEISTWLRSSGLTDIKRTGLLRSGTSIITGSKL